MLFDQTVAADRYMRSDRAKALAVALAVLLGFLALSGAKPFDRATWAMEVFPIFIAVPVLWATYQRFPLTTLLYACIFVHALVLMLGGMYTYARVPLGFQIADLLGLHRNPYDKIGHFFQGFVPALAAREILIRGDYVRGRKMLAFVVVCIVLAISATYEFIEWGAALSLGQGAEEFLGTQGDPWDTQSDMFSALIGAVAALLLLSRLHDRQILPLMSAVRRRELMPPAHSMVVDPRTTYVHLGADGVATQVAGGEAFWSLTAEKIGALGNEWLVSEFDFASDWPTWEMHPHGDEFVYLLSGSVELLLERPTGVESVSMLETGAVVVPRGVWHTARIRAPSRMLHITLGAGTETRPV